MNIAAQMSREKMADGEGGPFGAIIVWNDKVIGQGWNQVTSRFDPSAHAEIVAIRNACDHLQNFSLKGAVIYTSCEPCPMCLGAIWWARLDSIYYSNSREDAAQIGFDDAEIYKEVSRATSERHIPMIRCESENAKLAMEEWKRKEDKILY
ncbi:MAG: tRNA-specific adenosine deaminase [Acidiferrobacteraceae bacterium]|nr:tRNA-specific adenosine deaminase [Acidiferrobacteraceae bacterium]|tara:strand:+ start:724 stop:1176 length:453 start_codon:yes stop_codon:yes gene_type:complete